MSRKGQQQQKTTKRQIRAGLHPCNVSFERKLTQQSHCSWSDARGKATWTKCIYFIEIVEFSMSIYLIYFVLVFVKTAPAEPNFLKRCSRKSHLNKVHLFYCSCIKFHPMFSTCPFPKLSNQLLERYWQKHHCVLKTVRRKNTSLTFDKLCLVFNDLWSVWLWLGKMVHVGVCSNLSDLLLWVLLSWN